MTTIPLPSLAVLFASVAAGAALWCIWPAGSRAPVVPGGRAERRLLPRLLAVGVAAAVGGAAVGLAPVRVALWTALGAGVAWAARSLLRRHTMRRRRLTGEARVLGLCDLLAAELAAGAPPTLALSHAAEDTPSWAALASTVAVGGDVPEALRAAARTAGHEDLALLAAAWQVSAHHGSGLTVAVQRLTESLRADHATRRVVAGELASARATARLMAGLPVAAWAMGGSMGTSPVAFLTTTPLGVACLAAGLGFGFGGLLWIERIADSAGGAAGVGS